ncbi:hypothetical protein JMM81_20815 [Bacillus sp. V3B]|uniref:hypothetical protein n=1 Tax=Bacillus sp. V3B TaxID=2804915 RepID=UPI00210B8AFF|nr:hypothetical protein [Bacillus sp. V3B]MCQ6277319.1 hypothetical protein [Bacillus sp. V3B]
MKKYLKDRLLRNSIEAHIRIVNEGEAANLEEFGFEAGTPIERIHQYNALTILSKLDFSREESLDPKSKSTSFLDELAKSESNVETIIEKLTAYREEIVNS